MEAAYGVRRSTGNPLGVTAAVAGVAGSLCGSILWLYQLNSTNSLLGPYAYEMGHGGPLRTTMFQLALGLGAVALLAALLACIGSARVGIAAGTGIVLGIVAISYPVMVLLGVVDPVGTLRF